VIDRDLILRKLDGVRHHSERLRHKLPASADVLVQSEDLRDIVANNVSQAVQFAFDAATQVRMNGRIAGWVAPPERGINNLPVEYEYVRLQ